MRRLCSDPWRLSGPPIRASGQGGGRGESTSAAHAHPMTPNGGFKLSADHEPLATVPATFGHAIRSTDLLLQPLPTERYTDRASELLLDWKVWVNNH